MTATMLSDGFYDVDDAVNRLNDAIKEKEVVNSQLTSDNFNQFLKDDCTVMKTGEPSEWRLVTRLEDGKVQEVIVSIQGVLCKKDLPPVDKRNIPSAPRVRYLQQVVAITGLHSVPFSKLVANIHFVQMKFARQFKEGVLEAWKPSMLHDEFLSVDAANRYFTPIADASSTAERLGFGIGLDPEGCLNGILSHGQLVHLKDNEVLYFEKYEKEKRDRHRNALPNIFRLGDLVEAQLAFICVPVGQHKLRMRLVLRSLSLEDSSVTESGDVKRLTNRDVLNIQTSKADATVPVLKRVVGYGEDEDDDVISTRQQVANLNLIGAADGSGNGASGSHSVPTD